MANKQKYIHSINEEYFYNHRVIKEYCSDIKVDFKVIILIAEKLGYLNKNKITNQEMFNICFEYQKFVKWDDYKKYINPKLKDFL